MNRVWKGILGIRDLTKIRCRIRENAKYLDGIRDSTATREAGFAKIWARDAGFFGLSVGNSGNRHDQINFLAEKANQPGEHKISIERANLHLKFISFCRNLSFLMYIFERKAGFGIGVKSTGCRILVKKGRECGIRTPPPFQTLVEVVSLNECTRHISRHLQLHGLSADKAVDSEFKLLLARAGNVIAIKSSSKQTVYDLLPVYVGSTE